MRPVSPNTGAPERVFAEHQEEYLPLSVAEYVHVELRDGQPVPTSRSRVTAWVPTREELADFAMTLAEQLRVKAMSHTGHELLREALAGAFRATPIYLALTDFGSPLTPHMVTIGPQPWMRVAPDGAPDGGPDAPATPAPDPAPDVAPPAAGDGPPPG
jgi:hypothetical protein